MDWRTVKTIELDGAVYELSIVKEEHGSMWEVGSVVCGENGRMRIQSCYGKHVAPTGYASRAKVLRMRKTYPQRKV